MSATLTWFSSGMGTKTGTGNANIIADMATLVASKSGDANFKWEVASSNTSTNPFYLVLKRKDGSAGRILHLIYTSTPAGFNPALWLGFSVEDNNFMYTFWHPNATTDTPANLTASSGAVLGNDTGATGFGFEQSVASIYAANLAPFYFDSAEGICWGFGNPAASTSNYPYFVAAGDLLVDASDVAYGCVASHGNQQVSAHNNASQWSFKATGNLDTPTSSNGFIRSNYGGNKKFYQGSLPSGWASQVAGTSDPLTDTTNQRAYFAPVQLMSNTKGEGFVLKLRQIAHGPASTSDFQTYQTTGPVVVARQVNCNTGGLTGALWVTNIKI